MRYTRSIQAFTRILKLHNIGIPSVYAIQFYVYTDTLYSNLTIRKNKEDIEYYDSKGGCVFIRSSNSGACAYDLERVLKVLLAYFKFGKSDDMNGIVALLIQRYCNIIISEEKIIVVNLSTHYI